MATGIKVFASLDEALEAGYSVFDRTPDRYIVRKSDGRAFSLAFVKEAKRAPEEVASS